MTFLVKKFYLKIRVTQTGIDTAGDLPSAESLPKLSAHWVLSGLKPEARLSTRVPHTIVLDYGSEGQPNEMLN